MLNKIPGINAVAGLHDVFQVRLDNLGISYARDIFNIPGMLPATVMTYGALLDGIPGDVIRTDRIVRDKKARY